MAAQGFKPERTLKTHFYAARFSSLEAQLRFESFVPSFPAYYFRFPFLLVEGKGPRRSEETLHPENTHAKALSLRSVGSLSTLGMTDYRLIVMRLIQLQNWIRTGHFKIQDEGHSTHANPESCQ
jgi:hypothetical protein